MARVRKDSHASVASGSARHKEAGRATPSYKVVLEQLTRERKLKTLVCSQLTGNTIPPKGYTFIPAGDPQLNKRCKKLSKEMEVTVYIVSARASRRSDLAKVVTRVGFHFATTVVEKACQSLGVTLNAAGRVIQSQFAVLDDSSSNLTRNLQKSKAKLQHNTSELDSTLSQATIDSQARDAIRDLFPRIPERDMHEVIIRAFDKRKGLVGTAEGAPLARRVNLAVVAHIRHVYTNYDELLRSGVSWQEARRGIEPFTLDKLVAWRGEEDDDPILDEVLREVVVISDDEGDSVDVSEQDPLHHGLHHEKPFDDLEMFTIDLTGEDDEETAGEIDGPYLFDPNELPFGPSGRAEREVRSHKERHSRWEQAVYRSKNEVGAKRSTKPPLIPGLDSYNQSIITHQDQSRPSDRGDLHSATTTIINNDRTRTKVSPRNMARKDARQDLATDTGFAEGNRMPGFKITTGPFTDENNAPNFSSAPKSEICEQRAKNTTMATEEMRRRLEPSRSIFGTTEFTAYPQKDSSKNFAVSERGPGYALESTSYQTQQASLARARKPRTVLIPLDAPNGQDSMTLTRSQENGMQRQYFAPAQGDPSQYDPEAYVRERRAIHPIAANGNKPSTTISSYDLAWSNPSQFGRPHGLYEGDSQIPTPGPPVPRVPRIVHLSSAENPGSRYKEFQGMDTTDHQSSTMPRVPRLVRLGPDDFSRSADLRPRQRPPASFQVTAPGPQDLARPTYAHSWQNGEPGPQLSTARAADSRPNVHQTGKKPREIILLDD